MGISDVSYSSTFFLFLDVVALESQRGMTTMPPPLKECSRLIKSWNLHKRVCITSQPHCRKPQLESREFCQEIRVPQAERNSGQLVFGGPHHPSSTPEQRSQMFPAPARFLLANYLDLALLKPSQNRIPVKILTIRQWIRQWNQKILQKISKLFSVIKSTQLQNSLVPMNNFNILYSLTQKL